MENNCICKKCGCGIFEIVTSGPHKKLICSNCNSYIAFVSSSNLELKYKESLEITDEVTRHRKDYEEGEEDELPWD